jgi:cytochrome c-type biogenesis protein CcmH/NrfG
MMQSLQTLNLYGKQRLKIEVHMAKNPSSPKSGYIKTQSMIGFVCLAFFVGLFSGIVLTIYKTGSTPSPMPAGAGAPGSGQMPSDNSHIEAFEKEVAANPQNAGAWMQLGNLYFDKDNFPKAISAYEKALELEPENADVLSDLGVMYRRNKQPEKAVDAFDRAVAINPGHQTARFNKGIVLMHDLDDNKAALAAWEELVSVNPQAKAPNGQPVSELIQQFKAQGEKSE